MLAPSSQLEKQRLKAARDFAAELLLALWVCKQNVAKGVSPTVGDIIQQRAPFLAAMPCSSNTTHPTSLEPSAEYKWSKAFRARWDFRQSKAAEREEVPLQEMRSKA